MSTTTTNYLTHYPQRIICFRRLVAISEQDRESTAPQGFLIGKGTTKKITTLPKFVIESFCLQNAEMNARWRLERGFYSVKINDVTGRYVVS